MVIASPRTARAAALALLTAACVAQAAAPGATYSLLPAQSSLVYDFMQAGAQNQGRFKSFSTRFDPGAGRLEVLIDMRSFDTGDQQRNGILGGKDFFDVAQYPQARFTATRIERTASGYDAVGSLTLRGVTRTITVPFTWRTADVQGRAVGYLTGRTTLHRLDFGVGQGQWQSTEWVGNDVTVSYSLTLTAN